MTDSRRHDRGLAPRARSIVVLGAASMLAGAPLLLARMRRDLGRDDRLRTSTAGWMWTAYTAYAALTTAALTAKPATPQLPPALRAAAATLAAAGGMLDLATLRRSPAALALTAGLAVTYHAWVPVEERHLARHFGEPYRRYRDTTPRWVNLHAADVRAILA